MPNVVCVVIDRLRASALGAYGAAWCDTPAFDRLAAGSVLFDQMLVQHTDLAAIYDALWSGDAAGPSVGQCSSRASLPRLLNQRGLHTALLTDETEVAEHPLAGDFASRELISPPQEPQVASAIEETQLARLCAAAVDWIEQRRQAQPDEPFLLWLHAQGMGGAWDAPLALRNSLPDDEDPDPYDGAAVPDRRLPEDFDPDELLRIGHAYAGQVMLLDACLAGLLETLDAVQRETLLVVLGARGFPLGEHRRIGPCDEPPYGETLHVPLLVRMADGNSAMCRTEALVVPGDLPTTLLAACGVDLANAKEDSAEEGLLEVIGGEAVELRAAVRIHAADGRRAFRTSAWHLIVGPDDAIELYAKPDDRWEANEISDRCPDVVADLTAALVRREAEA